MNIRIFAGRNWDQKYMRMNAKMIFQRKCRNYAKIVFIFQVLLQTAGIVLLTLCVNGTTTKKLLEVLKLTEISPGRFEEMKSALKTINVSQKKALIMLRHDRFLSDANWTYVSDHTKIDDPYKNVITFHHEKKHSITGKSFMNYNDLVNQSSSCLENRIG